MLMEKNIRMLFRFLQEQKKNKVLRRIAGCMAGIIVFTTTYTLILPAITLEDEVARKMPGVALQDSSVPASETARVQRQPSRFPQRQTVRRSVYFKSQ